MLYFNQVFSVVFTDHLRMGNYHKSSNGAAPRRINEAGTFPFPSATFYKNENPAAGESA